MESHLGGGSERRRSESVREKITVSNRKAQGEYNSQIGVYNFSRPDFSGKAEIFSQVPYLAQTAICREVTKSARSPAGPRVRVITAVAIIAEATTMPAGPAIWNVPTID
jgi:hypothetical protein